MILVSWAISMNSLHETFSSPHRPVMFLNVIQAKAVKAKGDWINLGIWTTIKLCYYQQAMISSSYDYWNVSYFRWTLHRSQTSKKESAEWYASQFPEVFPTNTATLVLGIALKHSWGAHLACRSWLFAKISVNALASSRGRQCLA
jgi:hypothetical protein